MTFKTGDPKPANSGRKPGVKNKSTVVKEKLLTSKCKFDPLPHLIEFVNSPNIPLDTKVRILCELMKYFHPQQKAMSVEFDSDLNIKQEFKVSKADIKEAVNDIHKLVGE